MRKKKQTNVSYLLIQISRELNKKKTINYKSLINKLGNQTFGLIIILFALPNLLPLSIIPGFSLLFGLPIIFVALHLIIGIDTLWLPPFLATREVDPKQLESMIKKTVPYLKKMERILKPRLLFITSKWLGRIHGLILFCLSFLLTLPVPFSNFVIALLIILLGLGLAEDDGLIIVFCYLGVFSLFFIFTQLTQMILSFF